jgi:hypothetical protein
MTTVMTEDSGNDSGHSGDSGKSCGIGDSDTVMTVMTVIFHISFCLKNVVPPNNWF